MFQAEGWRHAIAPGLWVSAKSCELRTGNTGDMWEASLQGEGPGLGLHSGMEVCPSLGPSSLSCTLSTPPSTWSPAVSCLPMFLNSGFHHRNLPLLLSQILPSCQPAGALPGNLPGRVPVPDTCCFQARRVSHSRCLLRPSFPIRAGPSPQPIPLLLSMAAQTLPLCVPTLAVSDPQSPPNCICPLSSPTGDVHYQGAKNSI